VNTTITSDGMRLAAYLASPPAATRGRGGGVVLCHGFPSGPRGAATSAATYPELADRIVRHAGWAALAFNFRGTGTSDGDFSIAGWMVDLRAAIGALGDRPEVSAVYVAGVAEGGTLAICVAADDPRVRGIATMGAPASLRGSWDPARLLEHARRVGMVRALGFPPDPATWGREVTTVDALAAARRVPPRPLLVLHGSDDDVVPASDARALCDAAGPGAELRLLHAAGHRLRHDPRAIAVLLGWLERQLP
jgi:uncharacterized protein